jgi:superfamily II DNA helicase RecQ
MRNAGALMMDRGVQMIYLTATLSPSDEAEFMEIMKVQIPNDCKFRGCTSRPNIAHSVVEHDIEQTEAVCQLVAEKLEQYPAPVKIIVYSSSIETIKELGSKEALNCHTYYADVGSTEEKDQMQQRWGKADGRVIVASNAFGLGINQPDVRVVIHVGPIYRMRDYGQESGRGRRDRQRSEAIILIEARRPEALQAQSRRRGVRRVNPIDKAQMEKEKVHGFISGAQCRRIHLYQEMDRRTDRIGCKEGEERCDVCQKDDEAEGEALQHAFAEQERMLDSAINMPSSSMQENPPPSSSIDTTSSMELPDISRFTKHNPAQSPRVTSSDPEFTTDLISIADKYEF